VGFRYATDARAFCFAIAARDVRAVAVAVDVAVDVVPQGVIIAFVSVMDLVLFSVNFEASKDKTILAQRDSRHAVRQSPRAARFPAITPMRTVH
jgi:hypothetical protein